MGKDEGGKGGVVINISSIAGLAPFAGSPIYVATKHAVIGLTRSFAVSTEYNNVGILYQGTEAFVCCVLSFGDAPGSEFYIPTFRNALSVLSS
jgi:NAD(P)-dependent dehydrogenase (short-subunit alcohol dehydrogenase family)